MGSVSGWRSRILVAGVAASLFVPRRAAAAWPSLDEAIARAKTSSLEVTSARGNVAAAQATTVGARVAPITNPYLEVQANAGRFTQDVAINAFLAVPVEIHGQRGARIDEAHGFVNWRQTELFDAQARTTSDVIAAYGDVLVAAARVADASRAEEDARTEVTYYAQRLLAGDVTVFEKSLAEAELARWSQTRAEARLRLVDATASLAELTAQADLEAPQLAAPPGVPPLRAARAPAQIAELVERAPVLRALGAEGRFWDASRERSAAEKNAPLSLIVNGGRGDGGELRAGGGLAWSIPVARRNQGEIARAEAEKARVVAYRETLRNVLLARARAAFAAYALSRDAVVEQDTFGIPAAQRVVDAAFASYKAGKGELLRVLIARRDLAVARSRRLDLVLAGWRAYAAIAALEGGLP